MLKALNKESHAKAVAPRELVVFRVGTQEFGIDVAVVREIRGWTPATLLPESPPYMRGVINLRGTVLPIVDVGARLNFAVDDPTAHHVVIVVSIEGKLVGLLVDAVCDLLAVPDGALQSTPDVACGTVHAFVEALVTVGSRMIGLITPDQILADLGDQAS